MKTKKKSRKGYLGLCSFLVLFLFFLSSCGAANDSGGKQPDEGVIANAGLKTDAGTSAEQEDYSWIPEGREWVYLPESVLIEEASAKYYMGRILGDTYCYSYYEEAPDEIREIYGSYSQRVQELRYCRYDLSTKELEKIQFNWDVKEGETYTFCQPMVCENFNIWVYPNLIREGESRPWYYSALFDRDGNCLYSEERAEWREYLEKNHVFMNLCSGVDVKGRLYEFDVNKIMLWDADGTPAGSISHDDWTGYFPYFFPLTTEDGKLIELLRWGGNGYNVFTNGMLVEVDFDGKTVTTLAEGEWLKEIFGIGKAPETLAGKTGYYDFVMYDERAVYGYSIADGKREELFTWKECNITGKEIYSIGTMPDGRLYAIIDDWRSEDHRIAVFTEVSREEAPPMTTMVLATVGEIGDDLNATAMRFNRYSFPYRVEVKSYESVNDLYNALLTGEQIDILDLSRVKLSVLTGQGLLEDLAPYLEKSESGYHREDFVEGILEAYTVDGVLTGIPDSFSIRTVAGDLAKYGGSGGGNGGLTLEAFLTAAEQNPNAKILEGFDVLTREELMQYLLMFNMEEFVDWETGECRFDSEQFKRVLDCVKRFQEADKDAYAEVSLPTRLQSGEILYQVADMNNLLAVDLYQAIFEKEDVCIGFPTPDGSGGHLLITNDAYGIMATSRHKDAAWKFLESVINHRVKYSTMDTLSLRISYNRAWKIYPTLQKTLEDFIDDMEARYKESEDKGSSHGPMEIYGEDWLYEERHLSREEMKAGPDLVKTAKPYFDAEGDAIIRIVGEEAPAYYNGQKSLDAVAEIIQNRVKLYVMENR